MGREHRGRKIFFSFFTFFSSSLLIFWFCVFFSLPVTVVVLKERRNFHVNYITAPSLWSFVERCGGENFPSTIVKIAQKYEKKGKTDGRSWGGESESEKRAEKEKSIFELFD
jgi:hypothetical protein